MVILGWSGGEGGGELIEHGVKERKVCMHKGGGEEGNGSESGKWVE